MKVMIALRTMMLLGGIGAGLASSFFTSSAQVPTALPTQSNTGPTFDIRPREPVSVGILVKDGDLKISRSPSNTVIGADAIGRHSASNISVVGTTDDFNALYVSGSGSYFTLSDSTIDLKGRGSYEFSGLGAGALVGNGGALTLRRVRIETHAAGSSCLVATTNGVARVYDSELIAYGGAMPPNTWQPPIGVTGSARSSNVTFGGRLYFYNTKIRAEGWGAMSTDSKGAYVECNSCDISTGDSGYGTFADAGVSVVLNDSRVQSATYVAMIAAEGALTLNNVQARSRGQGVVAFNVLETGKEIGVLTINGGELYTAKDAFLVRSGNLNLTVNRASIVSDNGVLLHTVVNEDPSSSKSAGKAPGTTMTVLNSRLEGDVLNEDPLRTIDIHLIGTSLRGAIRQAALELNDGSTWFATKDSEVQLAPGSDISHIDAGPGVTIRAKVEQDRRTVGESKLKSGGSLILTDLSVAAQN